MGSRANNSGRRRDMGAGSIDSHSSQDDEWETAVAGGYAVLLCLMGLRCLVSFVRTALSLFKPHVPLLEGDVDKTDASTVSVKRRPRQTFGRGHLSQDEDLGGKGFALGSSPPRSRQSWRAPQVKRQDPPRQPNGKCWPLTGGAQTPSSSLNDSRGVRGSALTSGDGARLSKVRLERSGSTPYVAPSHSASYLAPLDEEPEQWVDATAAPSSTMTPHGFGQNRWVDVVTVALNQMCGEDSWYTSTKELQLASLQVCVACRSFMALNLTVDHDTPPSLLEPDRPPSLSQKTTTSSRVPQLRPRALTWNFATLEGLRSPMPHPLARATGVKYGHDIVDVYDIDFLNDKPTPCFGLGALFHGRGVGVTSPLGARLPTPMEKVVFLASLRELTFGRFFNQRIEGVVWPASLKQLTFGKFFNQRIQRVVWPASLQQLKFGDGFDYPIQGTQWPASLRRLEFGLLFDQPVAGVAWPDSLRQLSFGAFFNEPLDQAVLPAYLTHLTLGKYFNQPIERVTWPDSVRELSFGENFDQPVERVTWPNVIRKLSFGEEFNQPIEGVIWPNSITTLSLGEKFNQPIAGVTWPAGLQTLSFGVPLGDLWWSNVRHGLPAFDQAMGGVRWPRSLRRLSIGGMFRQPLQELGQWMPNLEELRVVLNYGGGYRALLGGIEWPKRLSKLGVAFNAVLREVAIPSSVEIIYMVSQRQSSVLVS